MKKDLDNLIKEKIEGYSEPFDNNAWAKMQNNLNASTKNYKRVAYWSSAALLISVCVSIALWNNQRQQNSVSVQPISSGPQSTQSSHEVNLDQSITNQENSTESNAIQPNSKYLNSTQTISNQTIASNQIINGKMNPIITENLSKNKIVTSTPVLETNNLNVAKIASKKNKPKMAITTNDNYNSQNKNRIVKSNVSAIVPKIKHPITSEKSKNLKHQKISSKNNSQGTVVTSAKGSAPSSAPNNEENAFVNKAEIGSEFNKSQYLGNESQIIVEGYKKLQVLGNLPESEHKKLTVDSTITSMLVHKEEDTAIPIPKISKKFKPTYLLYAGVGASISTMDKDRNGGQFSQESPQFNFSVYGGLGFFNKRKISMLEILSGIGYGKFNYTLRGNPNSMIIINDSTHLNKFTVNYSTIFIPVIAKFNFYQSRNVSCYVKLQLNNHFVIKQRFHDEYQLNPNPNSINTPPKYSQNGDYNFEDFQKQKPEERNAKAPLFNNRDFFLTYGMSIGAVWKWLFVEGSYNLEPNVARRDNKHDFGVQTGIRINFTK